MKIEKKSSEALHRGTNKPRQTFATPEQFDLWQKMKEGDSKAEDELIRLNTGLMNRWVSTHANEHYFDDLKQAARIAIRTSLHKFDPNLGFKFSTYANWWLRRDVKRAANRHRYGHKIPENVQGRIEDLYKIENSLTMSLGRQPTEAEIVEDSDFDLEEIEYLKLLNNEGFKYLSLDDSTRSNLNFESGAPLKDLLFDKDQLTPEELAVESIHRQEIRRAMDKLPEIQLGVVLGRNGFIGGLIRGWQELADEFGVSMSTIRGTIDPLSSSNMRLLLEYYSTKSEIWQNLANSCNLTPFRAMLHCHFLDSLTESSSKNLSADQIVNRIEILNLSLKEDLDEQRRQIVILLNGLGERVPISPPEIKLYTGLDVASGAMGNINAKAKREILKRLNAEIEPSLR